jgi:crotonobetainyl-CoA:carnitine CoA-transferase CaiB-like acyl-CoA transferase
MEKLGLGYETLRQIKPDLIMMSLSACGSTGPWRNFSALHSGVICLSGLAAVTGYEDGHPRIVGAILPDPVAATYSTLGILQALYHRNRTGRGQHIEVAMTETLQSLIPEAILEYTLLGREPERIGNRHPWKAPHGIYRAQGDDRWLAISVETDAEWRTLCQVMDRPGLADDPRFADPAGRRSNGAALDAIVADWSRAQVAEDTAERLQQAGVPATLVYNSRDVLTDSHLIERGFIVEDDHPRAGRRPMPGAPWFFQEMPPITYHHAPLVGQDNEYVFGEILGLDAEQVRELEAAKVIY